MRCFYCNYCPSTDERRPGVRLSYDPVLGRETCTSCQQPPKPPDEPEQDPLENMSLEEYLSVVRCDLASVDLQDNDSRALEGPRKPGKDALATPIADNPVNPPSEAPKGLSEDA